MTTISGKNGKYGFKDGRKDNSLFNYPTGICFNEKQECLFICDCQNHRIRKYDLKSGTYNLLIYGIDISSVLLEQLNQNQFHLFQETQVMLQDVGLKDGKMEMEIHRNSITLKGLQSWRMMDHYWLLIVGIIGSDR